MGVAHELRRRIAAIPGIADAHLQQELDAPAFMATIDRSRALQLGLHAQAIATDLNTSLSSSEQVAPISGPIRQTEFPTTSRSRRRSIR